VELVGPSVDDGVSVELVHGGHDTVLELLFGCDADMAQHRAGELGEETLDEVKPGAVLAGEGEFEAAGRLLGEPSLGVALHFIVRFGRDSREWNRLGGRSGCDTHLTGVQAPIHDSGSHLEDAVGALR